MDQMTIFDFLNPPKAVVIPPEVRENVVLGSSIGFKEARGFYHIRKCDNHLCKMWYGIVPGPLGSESTWLVLKEHYTYIHIRLFDSEKQMRKWIENVFMKQVRDNGYEELPPDALIGDFIGPIPDLYLCRSDVDWDYAEEKYSGVYVEGESLLSRWEVTV